MEAGFYASAPLIFGAIGNWFSGLIVDAIYRRNKWKLSRKAPAIIGFSLVIFGMTGSIFMNDVLGAVVMLSIAVFGADMTLSPSWSFCIDIGKENSGTVSGTMNMAGNIGSFITALAFPYLLSWTGSEKTFFIVASVLAFISIFSWMGMNPEKPLTD
jgi:ACS family glucarate transporter-like MFS transporter